MVSGVCGGCVLSLCPLKVHMLNSHLQGDVVRWGLWEVIR